MSSDQPDKPSPRRKIPVSESDPAWAEEGRVWAHRVRTILGDAVLDIDHVGSTAVPGLAAKNVLDIQALVYDLDEAAPVLEALRAAGWRERPADRGQPPRPGYPADPDNWDRILFREPEGERRVDLHLREVGTAAARTALLLRDFLRADAMARDQYDGLKRGLALHVDSGRAYAALKRPFVGISLHLAEAWAERVRWRPGAGDA